MARHDPHDHARRKGTTRKRDDDGLSGHRPHGRLTAYRTSGGRDDPQAFPDVRPPSAGAHRRRDGHDRRPQRQVAGAQPARRADAPPQSGGDQAAARQTARLRVGRAECRRAGQQLRLDEGHLVPRIHPRENDAVLHLIRRSGGSNSSCPSAPAGTCRRSGPLRSPRAPRRRPSPC